MAVSDSSGIYRLSTPGPGDYRLTVEAFGYAPFQSHLLAVGERESYLVDIELTPTPLPVSGLVVSADRFEELERGLRLEIGVNPRALRYRPIMRPEIEDHFRAQYGTNRMKDRVSTLLGLSPEDHKDPYLPKTKPVLLLQ